MRLRRKRDVRLRQQPRRQRTRWRPWRRDWRSIPEQDEGPAHESRAPGQRKAPGCDRKGAWPGEHERAGKAEHASAFGKDYGRLFLFPQLHLRREQVHDKEHRQVCGSKEREELRAFREASKGVCSERLPGNGDGSGRHSGGRRGRPVMGRDFPASQSGTGTHHHLRGHGHEEPERP
jgi:hypothetical protein